MKSFWKGHFLTLILAFLDALAFSMIWRQAWTLRRAFEGEFGSPINAYANYQAILPKLLPVWLAVMVYFEHYAHQGKIYSLNQTANIIKAGLGIVVATMCTAYLFKQHDIGRSVIFLASAGMTAHIYLSRTILRAAKEWFIARGHGLTRVAIIGAGRTGLKVAERIRNHPEVGYELVGFIDREPALQGREVGGIRVIGGSTNLVDTLLRHRVEEVFLAVPRLEPDEAFNLIAECERARVNFKMVTGNLLQVITDRVKIDDIEDLPVILLPEPRLTPGKAILKRLLDLAVTFALGPFILLAMGVIALVVRLTSPGPALFVHERVGRDGRRFKMFKFRTMLLDANPYQEAPHDPSDSRITPFGRFLRKTSLDELPQFINVLKGEMSLVGPRPEMQFIVDHYEPWQRRRLLVLPGLTGLWQIAGRKRLPLHQNLEYDFYYIRNWSLLLDLEILIRTIPAVLFGRGAF